MPSVSPAQQRERNTVQIGAERVNNISSKEYPHHYTGEDHSWQPDQFRKNVKVQFHQNYPLLAVFSLIGVDPSFANALRRILLAEIPTLAIEDVFINQNTGIVHDEILAQRIGLVPLRGSKEGLRWLRWRRRRRMAGPSEGMGDDPGPTADDVEEEGVVGPGDEDAPTDFNTVQLEMKVACKWKTDGERKFREEDVTDPKELYESAHIYASDLKFTPIGQQEFKFPAEDPIRPVYPGILLDKLRPGHEIDLVCHANLGMGADHAKFSPVATASYRLLPTIDISTPIRGPAARRFQKCFPDGVIGLEKKMGKAEAVGGALQQDEEEADEAVVQNTFKDTVTREVLRHEEFKDKVKLGRQRDHFIFSVESTGQWDSDELVVESIKVLREKCRRLRTCLNELREVG
ncbi:MAG: hypothetical protein Q9159_000590 [Coniocarpon cinnabarinum]